MKLALIMNHMLSKNADLEKISLLVQQIMIWPPDFPVTINIHEAQF
jgi:hypothetical protein